MVLKATLLESLELLNDFLIDHHKSCDNLSLVLTQEQEAIIQNNGDTLMPLLEEKQVILDHIEANQAQVDRIIHDEFNVEKNSTAFMRFLKQSVKDDESLKETYTQTMKLWTQFIEQTQVIEHKNLVNGHLLNKQNAKNQLLIHLLRGQKPTENLYGVNGKSSKNSFSSHLGEA